LINLTQINKVNSEIPATPGQIYVLLNDIPLVGMSILQFRYYSIGHDTVIKPIGGRDLYIITSFSVTADDIVSFDLFTDNGYLVSNGKFEVTHGSGNRDMFIFRSYDSNLKYQFNDN